MDMPTLSGLSKIPNAAYLHYGPCASEEGRCWSHRGSGAQATHTSLCCCGHAVLLDLYPEKISPDALPVATGAYNSINLWSNRNVKPVSSVYDVCQSVQEA